MRPHAISHFPPKTARVHEVCGDAAQGFASICAAQTRGHILWIREAWKADSLNPTGAAPYFDPARMLLAQVRSQTEGLAVAEEALRDGAVSLVIVELTQSVDLTAGRRLQLAARAGNTTGLCIILEGMGSNAAQTRWRCRAAFDSERLSGDLSGRFGSTGTDSTLMHWNLIKNKSGTLCDWYVRWSPSKPNPADRFAVVSPPPE